MRIGLMLSMPGDPTGARGLVQNTVTAEREGFASGWLPQVSTYDALTVLALAGTETERIELGTAVVPTYPRHPTVVAMQALTVQDVSGGRLALGIGLSHRFSIENALGLDYSRPIPHMKDYLTVLNGLLAGEQVAYHGEEYRVNTRVTVVGAKAPPVLVAALGPDMLRLCGRLADGTITWMGGVPYLREVAVPTMSAAAAKAGKQAPRFVAMVPVLLTSDAAAGRDLRNTAFPKYGPIPPNRPTVLPGRAAHPAGLAVAGSQGETPAGLKSFAGAGVTDFVAAIPANAGPGVQGTRELLGALARES